MRRESFARPRADSFATASAWFAALKTPAFVLSGAPKDRFHFTESTEAREANNAGVSFGYGLSLLRTSTGLARKYYISLVAPGSPADIAGVKRGDLLVSVDGVDFQNADDDTSRNTIGNGLFPSLIGESHNTVFAPFAGGAQRSVVLAAASLPLRTVPTSGYINTPTGRVGYINVATFNSYVAEKAIADAVAGLVAAGGVTDLVLDLRYNSGGFVFISAETAFMIAGPTRTGNKVFESYKTNDKKPLGAPTPDYFYNLGSGAPGGVTKNQSSPSLSLSRVFVLTQSATCSASESVVNGLRGIDFEVILIGGQTCGKPYAFVPTDNCGVTYSTVQWNGVNNKGEGDFTHGFAPTCKANDDLGGALGSPAEKQLAAALTYRATGVCTPVSASSSADAGKKTTDRNTATDALDLREFGRRADTEKIMTPQDLDRSHGAPLAPAAPLKLGEVDAMGRAQAAQK